MPRESTPGVSAESEGSLGNFPKVLSAAFSCTPMVLFQVLSSYFGVVTIRVKMVEFFSLLWEEIGRFV